MSLIHVNFLLSLISLARSRSMSTSINDIERKLNFIRDDVSWIGSNDGGKLVKEITKLKASYEEELAKIHTQIIGGEIFKKDVTSLINNLQESHPEIFDFMIAHQLKLFDLVSLSSNNIIELFRISEDLAVKIEDAISSIGMTAMKYGMSLQDLSIKVDSNERYILILSQRLMDIQTELTSKFYGIKDELTFIQKEVDRQLQDIGLVSSNTTAVILSDGSLKISDNLTRYSNDIFVGKVETQLVTGSSTDFMNSFANPKYNENNAALSFNTSPTGAVAWSYSKSLYSDTKKIKNIVPIDDDQGVLLDTSISRDIIIQNISLNQPIFIILKGGGLANISINDITPMFRPAMIKVASLSIAKTSSSNGETTTKYIALKRSSFSTAETTVGAAGTFIIPVSNSTTNYPAFLKAIVQSKSDDLIVIKIEKLPGWNTLLGSGIEKGGYVSGKTFASMNPVLVNLLKQNEASASGLVFQPTPPDNIIEKGDLIVRIPISHLTFHGVEALF